MHVSKKKKKKKKDVINLDWVKVMFSKEIIFINLFLWKIYYVS